MIGEEIISPGDIKRIGDKDRQTDQGNQGAGQSLQQEIEEPGPEEIPEYSDDPLRGDLLESGPVLAPFYNLLSTRIYNHYGLTEKLAQGHGPIPHLDYGKGYQRGIGYRQWSIWIFLQELKILFKSFTSG